MKNFSSGRPLHRLLLVGGMLAVSFITMLTLPVTVSWDGYLYLGSGHALLHNEMASQYQWLRDPLYPLFIGLLSELHNPYLFTFLQALMLLAGIYLLAKGIFQKVSLSRATTGTLLTYSFVCGFASAILQQALIVFLSGVLVYGLFAHKGLRVRAGLVILSLLALSLTSTVVAFGGLVLIFLYLLVERKISLRGKLLAGIVAILAVFLTFSTWTSWKHSFDKLPSNYQGQRYFWEMDNYNNFVLPDKLLAIPSVIGALNSFGIEFYYSDFYPPAAETKLFGIPQLLPNQACGRLFPGPTEYISKSIISTPSYCVSELVLNPLSKWNLLLSFLLPIFSIVGFGILLVRTYKHLAGREFLLAIALLSGQLLLFPFWFGNVAISRLGLIGLITNLLVLFLTVESPKKLYTRYRNWAYLK